MSIFLKFGPPPGNRAPSGHKMTYKTHAHYSINDECLPSKSTNPSALGLSLADAALSAFPWLRKPSLVTTTGLQSPCGNTNACCGHPPCCNWHISIYLVTWRMPLSQGRGPLSMTSGCPHLACRT